MCRRVLAVLMVTALALPTFAQEVEKKGKKNAEATQKQSGKKKKKEQAGDTKKQESKAEERKKKASERRKKAAGARKRKQPGYVMNMLKVVELTDEQKPQVKKIGATYDPMFVALRTKQSNILTDEQKKAVAEARKKQREARKAAAATKKDGKAESTDTKSKAKDKKPKPGKQQQAQNRKRGQSIPGVQLTEEQLKQRQEIAKEQLKLRTEVLGKLKTVLNEDQLAMVPGGNRERKARGKKKKKSASKDVGKPTTDKKSDDK
ncbi:MAG: hypothetical protein AB8G99_23355 [Planctomycetaceae bacterium]